MAACHLAVRPIRAARKRSINLLPLVLAVTDISTSANRSLDVRLHVNTTKNQLAMGGLERDRAHASPQAQPGNSRDTRTSSLLFPSGADE